MPELIARAEQVRSWWKGSEIAPKGHDVVGLALSGGGIRSATFSLGLLQGLARREKINAIDVMSTVSGGSYIGCFLRTLFLPMAYRGIDEASGSTGCHDNLTVNCPDLIAQHAFALRVLSSGADETTVLAPGVDAGAVCNPIWWLRQHSRYLAPNGPTDYGYAAALLARNWLGMIYVFSLAVAAILSIAVAGEMVLRDQHVDDAYAWITVGAADPLSKRPIAQLPVANPAEAVAKEASNGDATADQYRAETNVTTRGRLTDFLPNTRVTSRRNDVANSAAASKTTPTSIGERLSPLLLLAVLPLGLAIGIGCSYWLTVQMSVNEPVAARQHRNYWMEWVCLLATGTVFASLLVWRPSPPPAADLAWGTVALMGLELVLGVVFVVLVLLMLRRREENAPALFTAELRRWLTSSQALFVWMTLAIISIALVDTLGAGLRKFMSGAVLNSGLFAGAFLPPLAFLIKKLPDWFGGKGGPVGGLLRRFLPFVALAAGVLLYGSVAVIVDAFIHAAAWTGRSWSGTPDWRTFGTMLAVLTPLVLITGRSAGFINLSSWHDYYAARLTRAYLGASNIDRLRTIADPKLADVPITENHPKDYIQPAIYEQLGLPAPLHVINMTVNRTIDPSSQIVSRDRKGELASMDVQGVRIGNNAGPNPLCWKRIGKKNAAQSLSLGQWCAISGAAASTGMGNRTKLGYSLAMSFANVRLGYWWWAPLARPEALVETLWTAVRRSPKRALGWLFPTFTYLASEMTARYSRHTDRQYLSDGGHFENLGAYALIRRGVPMIIISDNGEDQKYEFTDLENLVRLVRLDLGGEMVLLEGQDLAQFRTEISCASAHLFVDPLIDPNWKISFGHRSTTAIALAFRVSFRSVGKPRSDVRIVYLKPRMFAGLPEDVAIYAASNPTFPQQTTANQFFDESQWESYRCLGEKTIGILLDACPGLI